MKRICLSLVLLSIALISLGQKNEHLAFLETDSSWSKELFLFPLNFAKDIPYTGEEDARFPKGWSDSKSNDHWSYVFGWNIDAQAVLSKDDLEESLIKYFNGLMRSDKTEAKLIADKKGGNNSLYGTVKTVDAFFTKKMMTLNVKIEMQHCSELDKLRVLFRFSPQKFEKEIWEKLGEVNFMQRVAGCKETKAKELHALLSKTAEYGHFNGTVLVAEQGEVVYKQGFGLANFEWDVNHWPDTKLRLASVSKQFTAMAIMMLVEEDKLQLDVPISKYLPTYPKKNGDQITLHHLLTHASGTPNYTSFPTYRDIMPKGYSPEELVALFSELDLEFEPGTQFNYSNSGYVLLGYIIEQVSGLSYADFLVQRIFEPLGMVNSGYEFNADIIKNRAEGYERIGSKYQKAAYIDMSVPYAAGALYSTVEDMYLWDQALYSDQLVSNEGLKLIFGRHMEAWGGHYGYGWEIGKRRVGNSENFVETISHGGGINGFNTTIVRVPEDSTLVVLLCNTGGAPLNDMTTGILGILKGEPYTMPKKMLARDLHAVLEAEGVAKAEEFFRENRKSTDYFLNEREMNSMGYQLLQNGEIKKATAVFKWNVEAFPNSSNVYDSLGEILLLQNDTLNSIENYSKSVQLNPNNAFGIEVLESLGVNTSDLFVKVPVEHLRLLAGSYEAQGHTRKWSIEIEEEDGKFYGNDSGYRYSLEPQGEDKFVNPDDGAVFQFDASNPKEITFTFQGSVNFLKVR